MFLFRSDVEAFAARHGLAANLVHAVCLVESSGDRWAWNPEPQYRYLWDVRKKRPFRPLTPTEVQSARPPADWPSLAGDADQEWWAQRASWGVMQVMGAVAREYGFQEPYLTALCEVRYGLEFGCTVLRARLRWANGDVALALAAYNAGPGNARSAVGKAYAAKVLAQLVSVQERF